MNRLAWTRGLGPPEIPPKLRGSSHNVGRGRSRHPGQPAGAAVRMAAVPPPAPPRHVKQESGVIAERQLPDHKGQGLPITRGRTAKIHGGMRGN